jgi:RNA polymerase sigma factor (sigma-70 family)
MSTNIESLVADYGKMVSSIYKRMLQDADKAQDASQQAWLEIIQALPGFRGDAKISTWIYSVTQRVVLKFAIDERQYSTRFLHDYFRAGDMELPQTSDFDKEIWVHEMCDKCLTGMLHCLDNESRLLFIFREIVQLSYKEIAEIQQIDEQTVRQNVSRARKRLKNFLEDECVLVNPHGSCHCRMKKWVEEINLPHEYENLRKVARSVGIFKDSAVILKNK